MYKIKQKWRILSKTTGLNINSSDKKYKLTSRSVFSPSMLFCRLSSIFFIDSEICKTIPVQFPRCFTLFYEKDPTLSGIFFWISAKQLANYKAGALQTASTQNGGNFGVNPHACGFWLDVSFFSHVKKKTFAILMGRIVSFFRHVKSIVRSSEWLELICVWKFTSLLFSEYE